jgi:hypothetical protein
LRSAVRPLPVWFPLELPLRYKATSPEAIVSGTGFTRWIGSKLIEFTADESVRKHMRAEIAIAWPSRLNDHVRLQLAVDAIITESAEGVALARIDQYYFRTRGDWEPPGMRQHTPEAFLIAASNRLHVE